MLKKKFNRLSLLHNIIPIAILSLIWLAIVVTNFQSDTRFLTWDLMDSSFNPILNVTRSLTSAWQEFQGVGLQGGHGYGAQLPHALVMLAMSLVIPDMYLRYSFAFLMLGIGALGCFFVVKYLFASAHSKIHTALAVAASAIYMLHYGTVQTFYVHLEPFIVMYGLFPWVLLSLLNTIKKPSLNSYFVFFILNFFLSIIGFIPPIFISYVLFVGLILLVNLGIKPNIQALRRSVILVLLIAITNWYWFYPVLHFTTFAQQNYLDAKLNKFTTQEYIYKNQQYGALSNVGLMQSFYQDANDQDRFKTEKRVSSILLPWEKHFDSFGPQVIGYILFVLGVVGLVIATLRLIATRNLKWVVGIVGLVDVSLLATGTPILSLFSLPFRLIPFLNQAFRIPFSKISMSVTFFLAIGIVISLELLFHLLRRKALPSFWKPVLFFMLGLSLLWYSWPSFQGHYLYKGGKVTVPESYTHAIQFLNLLPSGSRIAPLPIATYSGWDMHQWNNQPGYTGSGFWWYAINKPLLHRSFDVWSPYNETFYHQLSTAIYDDDVTQLTNTLQKFDVSFVLLDESIILPDKDQELLYREPIKGLLAEIGATVAWQEGDLTVYDLRPVFGEKQFITVPNTVTQVNADVLRTKHDTIFSTQGSYLDLPHQSITTGLWYPFEGLTQEEIKNITYTASTAMLELGTLPAGRYRLHTPVYQVYPSYPVAAQLTYTQGKLDIRFPDETKIIIGQQVFSLPQLDSLSLDLPQLESEILIDIAGGRALLTKDQPQTVILNFETNRDIQLFVVNQLDIILSSDGKSSRLNEEDITRLNISRDVWQRIQALQPIEVNIEQPTPLKLTVDTSFSFPVLSTDRVQNCNTQGLGEIRKDLEKDTSFQYTANNYGVACDAAIVSTAAQQQGYLLHWQGENQNGRSVKFYVQNLFNDRSDLEVLLPSGTFDQTYALLAHPFQSPRGYSVHWDTTSFGQLSQNRIDAIRLYPFPFHALQKIYFEPLDAQHTFSNQLTVTQLTKTGTYQYQFNAKAEDSSYFALSQGYDPAWIAIAFPNLGLPKTLPHYRFNGWANAWAVPAGEYTIMVLYWPQILSFVGYGMLIATLVFFVINWRKQRDQSSPPHFYQLRHHTRQYLSGEKK